MESQQVIALPSGDEMLIRAWLHNRPSNTVVAYRNDTSRFLAHAGKSLASIELADLQAWDNSLVGDRASSRVRRLSAAKSLLSFAHGLGAIATDPGRALRLSKPVTTSAERILTEAEIHRMVGAEPGSNRRAMLRLLYLCGLRASEAGALCWRDVTQTGKAGQAKILGKGGKPRTVGIPPGLWRDLVALAPARQPNAPVVPMETGGPFNRQAIHRVVRRAAKRAGIKGAVSPHWLRHSHASHSLNHGCPPQVVQKNLGHASLATTTVYLHPRRGDHSANYLPDV
jgi:site-specific recombinase XerD